MKRAIVVWLLTSLVIGIVSLVYVMSAELTSRPLSVIDFIALGALVAAMFSFYFSVLVSLDVREDR